MLHKEIPFLRIGLPLCAGIITGLYFNPGTLFLTVSVIVTLSCLISCFLINRYDDNTLFGFFLYLALFLSGLLLYKNEKAGITILESKESVFICSLSDFPEEKEKSIRTVFRIKSIVSNNSNTPAGGSIVLYSRKGEEWKGALPGDLYIIKATPLEIVNRGNPFEFDYKFYMENHGIRYYAFTDSSDILLHKPATRRKLVHSALIIREKIINIYEARGISGENLGLVAAITLGQKRMLDPEQKQSFIRAGVMHIMAVSGLHAVILSMIVLNMLFFLRGRLQILRIVLALVALWCFAFVTGLTPSVLRATLMFSFFQAGKMLKRPVNSINSVLASAFMLIMIRPSVIFDAGFLLSYSAVIFIIKFYSKFEGLIETRSTPGRQVWELASVSIVAQAGTLPLSIMYFNRFPVYFLLANILIVPVSTLLIILGCLIPMTYHLPPVSFFLASVLKWLAGITDYITQQISSLPGSSLDNVGLSVPSAILLMAAIFLSAHHLLYKRSIPAIFPLAAMLLFVITGTIIEMSTRRTNELIVYNSIDRFAIGIRRGKELNVYSDSATAGTEITRHSAVLSLNIRMNKIDRGTYLYLAGDDKIMISGSLNRELVYSIKPEVLVLTGVRPAIDKNLSGDFSPSGLILTSANPGFFKLPEAEFFRNIDTIHFVKDKGAYRSGLGRLTNKNRKKVEY